MVDIITKILTPATNFDLTTLAEMKIMLGIATTDTASDAQIQVWITQYSDFIATRCNRVFAKEEVMETWRADPSHASNRIYLSHWPVKEADVASVECPRGTFLNFSNGDWELEEKSGKLEVVNYSLSDPVVVTYTGGYTLPAEAPPALEAAVELMIRAARAQAVAAAVAGIRSLSHKESRVMFFDPAAVFGKLAGGGPVAAAYNTIDGLLQHYRRYEV
jgi:hypothetical protein